MWAPPVQVVLWWKRLPCWPGEKWRSERWMAGMRRHSWTLHVDLQDGCKTSHALTRGLGREIRNISSLTV